MDKPKLLDLFCGAGGATKGYQEAGFYVVGVDVNPQPNYCGDEFIQDDAIFFVRHRLRWRTRHNAIKSFSAIHASPPCQAYTTLLRGRPKDREQHSELINPTRAALVAAKLPYVIENVEGAPLRDPIKLCGAMGIFPRLRVIRHRLFETNWNLKQPRHPKQHPLVVTLDKRKKHYKKLDEWVDYVGVYGGGRGGAVAAYFDAMQIDWMTKGELNQAIPPAYTKYIGEQMRKELDF